MVCPVLKCISDQNPLVFIRSTNKSEHFCQGQDGQRCYIVTKVPENAVDFWELVQKHNVSSIVMLNDLRANQQVLSIAFLVLVLFLQSRSVLGMG